MVNETNVENSAGTAAGEDKAKHFVRGRGGRFIAWLESLVVPWGRMLTVVLDPATLILGGVGVVLGLFGPRAVAENYNAVLQVVIAVVTGLVGARVSTALSALNQETKLHASGKMAVRGLRLILTKTLALERRVSYFVEETSNGVPIEVAAAVAQRNLDEVLESVRMLQLEIAGSIDNWVDVVPGADAASILVAVAELRDRVTLKDAQLKEAIKSKTALESKGTADGELLSAAESRIAELEREKEGLVKDIGALKKSVTLPTDGSASIFPATGARPFPIGNAIKKTKAVGSFTGVTTLGGVMDSNAVFPMATERHKLPD